MTVLAFSLFQSTPPRGWRRRLHRCSGRHRQFQSTPPRGWRHHRRAHGNDSGHFNPLHREGGDLVGGASILPVRDFNPLHREGGDWMCQTRWTRNLYFNPLHREGGDNSDGGVFQQYPKFQSTPPRGWRLIRAQSIMYVRDQFQSTPPRGWRQKPRQPLETRQEVHFNPLHREGGD